MAETTVVNVRTDDFDVYIGRANLRYGLEASPYANPFPIIPGLNTREEVIAAYREWVLYSNSSAAAYIREHVHELRGKRLGCWCHPSDCHGRVLAEMAGVE